MGKQKQDLGVEKGLKHLVQNLIWCSPLWDSSSATGIFPSQWYSSLHQVAHYFESNCSNKSSYTGSLRDLTVVEKSNRWMIARKMFKWKCFYWPRRQSIWGMSPTANMHISCIDQAEESLFYPSCFPTPTIPFEDFCPQQILPPMYSDKIYFPNRSAPCSSALSLSFFFTLTLHHPYLNSSSNLAFMIQKAEAHHGRAHHLVCTDGPLEVTMVQHTH